MEKKKIIDATTVITTIICLLTIVPGIVMWDRFPDVMATHFDMNGEPNGYMPKLVTVILLPLIMTAGNLVMNISYKFGDKPFPKGLRIVYSWIFPVVAVVVCSSIYMYNIGIEHNILFMAELLLAFIFIGLGNYLPKTPVELINIPGIKKADNSEAAVNRKKKIGRRMGICLVIIGFVILITSFTPINIICFEASLIATAVLLPVLVFLK